MSKSTRFDPQYYGIVFGFRQTEAYDGEIFEVLHDGKLEAIQSENNHFHHLFKKVSDTINKLDNALLTYHDGRLDQVCRYNGRHFHLVCELRGHPTRDQRWGRALLDYCRPRAEHVFFCAERVANVAALCRHVCETPRQVIFYKSTTMQEKIGFQVEMGMSLQVTANKGAKLRKDAPFFRIQFLTALMEKYRTSDMSTIKRSLIQNNAEWDEFVECLSGSGFDIQYKKATDIYRTKTCTKPLSELMTAKPLPEWNNKKVYIGVDESIGLLFDWIRHQGFDADNFINEIFDVLERKVPKKNTFCLMGPPNSGKSFVMRSIIPHFSYFGEVRGGGSNYTFLWQDCVDTAVIFIEEPMISPEVAEQFKLVMEGAPTHVHVKMRGDALLQPTPVLITTNSLPWRWCPNEAQAFQARMFFHMCRETPFLKEYKQQLNPQLWQELYKRYRMQEDEVLLISSDDDEDYEPPQKRQSCIAWAPKYEPSSPAPVRVATPPLQELLDNAIYTPERWWEHDNAQNINTPTSPKAESTTAEIPDDEIAELMQEYERNEQEIDKMTKELVDNLISGNFETQQLIEKTHTHCMYCGDTEHNVNNCPVVAAGCNSSVADFDLHFD